MTELVAVTITFILGAILATALFMITQSNEISMCQRYLKVDRCEMKAVPVTPDGQPLDMSDLFHPEEN